MSQDDPQPAAKKAVRSDATVSSAIEMFRKQQADLARMVNSSAIEMFRKQQADLARMVNSSAIEMFRKQQADLARMVNSPAIEMFRKQQADLARMVNSPAIEMLRKQQVELASIVTSPLFDTLRHQQADLARLASSSIAIGLEQNQAEMNRIGETIARSAIIDSLALVSTRIVFQAASLASMSEVRLGSRVGQATRGWALTGRRAVLEAALDDPLPLLSVGYAVQAVNTAAFDVESSEHIEEEPWSRARMQETNSLVDWLERANPKLAVKYKGAWRLVADPGPDWISQAANSAVELIDWTLRTFAPDDAVLEWQATTKMYLNEIGDNGKPRRALKIRYVASRRNLPASSVELIIKATTGVMNDLQKLKHASDEKMASALRSALMALDYCLIMLRGPE